MLISSRTGEMTSFVIDGCENITLKNFTVTAADPTVPELTATEVGDRHMTVRIHPQSKYLIKDGKFSFVGDSWTLSEGIAQSYDPEKDITWRSWSPLPGLQKAIELGTQFAPIHIQYKTTSHTRYDFPNA